MSVRCMEIKSNAGGGEKQSALNLTLWPQAVDKLWSVVVKQQLFGFKIKL